MPTQSLKRESSLVHRSIRPVARRLQESRRRIRMKREVGVGRNIADIVVMLSPVNGVRPAKPLSIFESTVLSVLRQKGPATPSMLECWCGIEPGTFHDRHLRKFTGMGAIRHLPSGELKLADDWLRDCSIIAVEAKLTRWRNALSQAIAYTRYADQSFVLLDEKNADPAIKSADEFRSAGIGLFVLRERSEIETVVDAKRHQTHSWQREFVMSRLCQLRAYRCE